MKHPFRALGFVTMLALGSVACEKRPLDFPFTRGDSIVVNPYKQWTTSRLPAYIGDLSAFPPDLQTVIRQRFPRQVSLEAAGVIFAGAGDIAEHADALSAAGAAGAFIVIPAGDDLTLLGAAPPVAPEGSSALKPLFVCYSGWGAGQYFVMGDEAESLQAVDGTPGMSEDEWLILAALNRTMDEDGGTSLTDYDNDASHNENYYQTRMDPFVEWIDAAFIERSIVPVPYMLGYDDYKACIEQSGQRLTYNFPISLNAYIDKAIWSDPDYLSKSGSVSVEFRVYPIYMLSANGDKAGDYYCVVSSVTPHNQSMWGPYAASHGACRNRIYGFWFNTMDIRTSLLSDSDRSEIPGLEYFERPLPENKNDSRTYSEGHTFSLSGSVTGGYSGGGLYLVGQGSIGGTWTSSTNYTLETINYTLDSSSPTVKYHYWSENVKLTDDWDDWSLINQNFPASVRTEFSAHAMWVWHVPGTVVKDYDTRNFRLRTEIDMSYSSWYHWRGAAQYDSNRKDHAVGLLAMEWTLQQPNRTPWGFIRLRNATSNEMAHVSFYRKGEEGGTPVARLSSSFGKGEEARIDLPEGIYTVTWDIVDGDTGARSGSWVYRDVEVHQGYDDNTSTTRISSLDGQPLPGADVIGG